MENGAARERSNLPASTKVSATTSSRRGGERLGNVKRAQYGGIQVQASVPGLAAFLDDELAGGLAPGLDARPEDAQVGQPARSGIDRTQLRSEPAPPDDPDPLATGDAVEDLAQAFAQLLAADVQ